MRNKVLFHGFTSAVLMMGMQHAAIAQARVENTGFSNLEAEPQQLAEIAPKHISVNVANASQIQAGQSKAQVQQILGEPAVKTSLNGNEGWEYHLSLPLADQRSIIVCQFMVVYSNATGSVSDAYWRRPQCAIASADTTSSTNPVNKVTFGFDQSELNASEIQWLNQVAATVKQQSQPVRLMVVGHADRLGNPDYNQKLSERRAQTVARYLVSQGISSQSIHTSGKGSTEPVVSCTGVTPLAALKDCLEPNRRVAIQMQPM